MQVPPILSIVVPVFKVEKYLTECIESILCSEFKDFELILVDDGSPDVCPEMCDLYALKDARIVVIHQNNRGLSGARNSGMAFAQGKIISFVDSDDRLLSDFFPKMLAPILNDNADMVCCGTTMLGNGLPFVPCPAETRVYLGDESLLVSLSKDGAQDFMMNKVYKRELLNGIVFPEGKAFEDIFVQHRILSRSKKTVFLNCALYEYRYNVAGISHNKQFKPNMIDFIEACCKQYEFALHNYSQYAQIAFAKYVNSIRVFAWYQYRNNNTHSRRKQIRDLSKTVKQNYAQIQVNPYISPLLQKELKYLKKGYMSWNLYCKKIGFIKSLNNHPRKQKLFAKMVCVSLNMPQKEDQY